MIFGCELPCGTTTDPVAFVREVEQSVKAARTVRVRGRPPVVIFGARGAFDDQWDVVSVYLVLQRQAGGAEPPRRWWMARRSQSAGSKSGPPVWTDTRTCPALASAIEGLDAATSVSVPLAENADLSTPPKYVADGTLVTLWSDQARQPGDWPARVLVSAFGGPLSDWGRNTLIATKGCWAADQPKP